LCASRARATNRSIEDGMIYRALHFLTLKYTQDKEPVRDVASGAFFIFEIVKFAVVYVELRAVERKGFRIILLEKGDEALADQAAEIECSGGVAGAHDGAKLHGPFGEIGDLKGGCAAVPKLCVLQDAVKLLADGRDGERIVHV